MGDPALTASIGVTDRLKVALDGVDRDALIRAAPALCDAILRNATVGGAWIDAEVLRTFQAHGLSLSRNHYYSIIPEIDSLPDRLWEEPPYRRGWDAVRCGDYLPLLTDLLAHAEEIRSLARHPCEDFYWDNPMYPPLDAVLYYGMIRAKRPRRVVEIGSGFSTMLALRAVDANGFGEVTCIEPFPRPELLALGDSISLRRSAVQEVPDDVFLALEDGDILFIDTSHTLKAGSDVNDILFRVLPLLAIGVRVHIHDVMLPFEYPRDWFEKIGIIWNEQYAVLGLLMNSDRYRVVLPAFLASVEHGAFLVHALREFDIWDLTMNLGGARGASLWIEVDPT